MIEIFFYDVFMYRVFVPSTLVQPTETCRFYIYNAGKLVFMKLAQMNKAKFVILQSIIENSVKSILSG